MQNGKPTNQRVEPSPERIAALATRAYAHLTDEMGYEERNIWVYGHSIGTGPATLVASQNRPGGLILLSPFTVMSEVVNNKVSNTVGWLAGGLLQCVVADHFNSRAAIKKVKSPCLFFHGDEDDLIPHTMSEELYKIVQKSGAHGEESVLRILDGRDHNIDPSEEAVINNLTMWC